MEPSLKTYIKLSATLIAIWPNIVVADQNQICEDLLKIEAATNAALPRKIDEYTELTQIIVNCDTEVLSYKKRILVPAHVLPDGAKERKQRQHIQLHCNKDGIARNFGWTAMDVIYDVNYEYVFTLITRPKNCDS